MQSLKVLSIADTQVTLFWESDPLYKQKGLVLYYQVGTDSINGNYFAVVSLVGNKKAGSWSVF